MRLDFAADFGCPPAGSDQEEAPVFEELRRLAFDSVTEELKSPAAYEECDAGPEQAMPEDAREQDGQREHDEWNAKGVSEPIQRVLMALCVFVYPTVPTAACKHAEHFTPLKSRLAMADLSAARERVAGLAVWRRARA